VADLKRSVNTEMPALYVSAMHPKSRRTATVDEAEASAWLYLSKPGSSEIEKDVWLYNRVAAPSRAEIRKYHGDAPPAAIDFIFGLGTIGTPKKQNIALRWSDDGEAVSVWLFAELHAFILPESRHGYCRLIRQKCPWGNPIDLVAYEKHLKS
jgi:hypothetical protein